MTANLSQPSSCARGQAGSDPDVDISCVRCGYNLRGLTRGGRCPECGEPIQTTLDAQAFDPLQIARWLRRCSIGAAWMILPVGVAIVARYASGESWWAARCTMILLALEPCFVWLGCRRIASPDFPFPEKSALRRSLRFCATGVVSLELLPRVLKYFFRGVERADWPWLEVLLSYWLPGISVMLGLIGSALLFAQLSVAATRLWMVALNRHARIMMILLAIPITMIAWIFWLGAWDWFVPRWMPGIGWTHMMMFYAGKLYQRFSSGQMEAKDIPGLVASVILYGWPILNTLLMIHVAWAATMTRRRIVANFSAEDVQPKSET